MNPQAQTDLNSATVSPINKKNPLVRIFKTVLFWELFISLTILVSTDQSGANLVGRIFPYYDEPQKLAILIASCFLPLVLVFWNFEPWSNLAKTNYEIRKTRVLGNLFGLILATVGLVIFCIPFIMQTIMLITMLAFGSIIETLENPDTNWLTLILMWSPLLIIWTILGIAALINAFYLIKFLYVFSYRKLDCRKLTKYIPKILKIISILLATFLAWFVVYNLFYFSENMTTIKKSIESSNRYEQHKEEEKTQLMQELQDRRDKFAGIKESINSNEYALYENL